MRRMTVSVLLMCSSLSLWATPLAKQLAGPPEEFAELTPAPLQDAGLRSKAALLPVHFKANGQGDLIWQSPVAIEHPEAFQLVVFSGESAAWNLSIGMPGSKRLLPAEALLSDYRQDMYGASEAGVPCHFYQFEGLGVGQFVLSIQSDAVREKMNPSEPDGYVLISSDNPYRLYSYETTRQRFVGEPLSLTAFGYDRMAIGETASPKQGDVLLTTAQLNVVAPSGHRFQVTMTPDSLTESDPTASWIGEFIPKEEGDYLVQVMAKGFTPEGNAFVRTTEHSLNVVWPEIGLLDQVAQTELTDDGALNILVPVDMDGLASGHYRTFAQVWGTSQKGETIPVAWVGGIVDVVDGVLPLRLDARWIGLAGAGAPFSLRELRVEETESYVPMIMADHLDVGVDTLPNEARVYPKTITEDMLMGKRPAQAMNKGSGSRLLLVHGYCSGNAWGPQLGQFSNASVFMDFNQNRSHDAFARRIRDFGNTWNSFGIVAHSQGGAAALHLYTYYWSGLDNAGSGRLIQSVGTPYQGTALAGNLALLGSIFGVGCGKNNDLTYSGASSWLSGIPNSRRSKVNYYTTSYRDRWWAIDYCVFGAGLVLSSPNDGTTERSRGQLSGAVNRGHKTGWCHTSGMRDPSQVTDGSRNSTMNANAAR